MTLYLLDTNVISEVTRTAPSPVLARWLRQQLDTDLFISALTVAEVWRGVREKEGGRKRRDLEAWFHGPDGPQALFRGRVLPFEERAALAWGQIMADGRPTGRTRSALDMVIAATAIANGCTVVTVNERHFKDVVEFINPLRAA